MSDILLNACDDNWWFGDTVKDFNAHKFLLATASPVFHKLLYDYEDEEGSSKTEKALVLDQNFQVTLKLVNVMIIKGLNWTEFHPLQLRLCLNTFTKMRKNYAF